MSNKETTLLQGADEDVSCQTVTDFSENQAPGFTEGDPGLEPDWEIVSTGSDKSSRTTGRTGKKNGAKKKKGKSAKQQRRPRAPLRAAALYDQFKSVVSRLAGERDARKEIIADLETGQEEQEVMTAMYTTPTHSAVSGMQYCSVDQSLLPWYSRGFSWLFRGDKKYSTMDLWGAHILLLSRKIMLHSFRFHIHAVGAIGRFAGWISTRCMDAQVMPLHSHTCLERGRALQRYSTSIENTERERSLRIRVNDSDRKLEEVRQHVRQDLLLASKLRVILDRDQDPDAFGVEFGSPDSAFIASRVQRECCGTPVAELLANNSPGCDGLETPLSGSIEVEHVVSQENSTCVDKDKRVLETKRNRHDGRGLRVPPLSVQLAHIAKAKVPARKHDNASVLLVRQTIAIQLETGMKKKEPDYATVRKADVAHIIDVAVELFFTPTYSAEELHKYKCSNPRKKLIKLNDQIAAQGPFMG